MVNGERTEKREQKELNAQKGRGGEEKGRDKSEKKNEMVEEKKGVAKYLVSSVNPGSGMWEGTWRGRAVGTQSKASSLAQ